MKIRKEYEKELIDKTQHILDEEVILNLQTVCLNLELMNDSRMEELSNLTLKLHDHLMMIRNELEYYSNRERITRLE